MKKLWFKRKRYGYGWTPSTWQGWLAILVYIICVAFFGNLAKNDVTTPRIFIDFVIPTIILTTILLIVCHGRGETPRWQWGKDSEDK